VAARHLADGKEISRLTVRAGAVDVAYDDVGEGPPVVLVHGGLGNRRMWAPQVRALSAAGYRCLACDLRGHGETTGGEEAEAFTPALLRDDLLAFADAVGLATFSLVGLSVGGLVAQEVAIEAPDRLDAVVIADAWVATGASERDRQAGRLLTPVVEGALKALGTGPLAYLAARVMGDRDEEARELVRAATAGTSPDSAIRVWRGLGVHDTRSRLGRVRTPTLVIAGARDMNLAQARLLATLVDDAELVVLPDAGHITNLHQPEAFTAAVLGFLSRWSPTSR
jgi:pimeloyl-ACP methyl ester carboxylesterase